MGKLVKSSNCKLTEILKKFDKSYYALEIKDPETQPKKHQV